MVMHDIYLTGFAVGLEVVEHQVTISDSRPFEETECTTGGFYIVEKVSGVTSVCEAEVYRKASEICSFHSDCNLSIGDFPDCVGSGPFTINLVCLSGGLLN